MSNGLEYIYRKTTAEVIHFNGDKLADKIGIMVDGVLYCKSRLMDDQQLRAVGGLEDIVDNKMFKGCNHQGPCFDSL